MAALRLIPCATLASLLATSALSGGIDRSGQSTSIIFEEGRYVELSFGYVMPDISGEQIVGGTRTGLMSDNVGVDYTQLGVAYKADLNETLSYALILEQAFGADVAYPSGTGYAFASSEAELDSFTLTGLLKYQLNPNVSVFGGLKLQSFEAQADVITTAGLDYSGAVDQDYGLGFVLGGAYEIPDIALRVALTYSSEIDYALDTTESWNIGGPFTSTTDVTTPQSLNLEFQTGVAADTLLFGSVRWVDWTAFDITPEQYLAATGGRSLVKFDDDTITYSLGLGRRFTENFSGAVTLGYEDQVGGYAANLGPTDGAMSIGLGGTYTMDNVEITGGVRYVKIGDAETDVQAPVVTGDFTDNDALAIGFSIGFRL